MEAKWSTELADAYSSVAELAEAGLISPGEALELNALGARFRVRLPRSYAALFEQAPEKRAACPIRRQALPALGENDPGLPGWAIEWSRLAFGRDTPWLDDAIGDLAKLAAPRLTHRYGNRAILHASSACSMYCRFCFRKSHLNDADRTLYEGDFEPALAYLSLHGEIRELILTGGDPLSLPDGALERLLKKLEGVKTLRHVRIHSRMSATLPSRLTPELARVLTGPARLSLSLVSHFNHPRELTHDAVGRLTDFRRAGVPLYNQTVLLRGVNDKESTLESLFQELYERGVRPFYLHHPDWTPGTFHFRLPLERGRELMRALRGRLSGPALPQYVLDLPGGGGKIPLEGEGWLKRREARHDAAFGGALYEASPPQTRELATGPVLYADFWKR